MTEMETKRKTHEIYDAAALTRIAIVSAMEKDVHFPLYEDVYPGLVNKKELEAEKERRSVERTRAWLTKYAAANNAKNHANEV